MEEYFDSVEYAKSIIELVVIKHSVEHPNRVMSEIYNTKLSEFNKMEPKKKSEIIYFLRIMSDLANPLIDKPKWANVYKYIEDFMGKLP